MEIQIQIGSVVLDGDLQLPAGASGLVLFAHGSGSSRLSPRNQSVARELNHAGIGTLLFDLLSERESENRENIFDIPFLARRLVSATHWLVGPEGWLVRNGPRGLVASEFPIGFFGASTGAGAALWAAAQMGERISAVVSRGGRPDLANPKLKDVTAPTLLIVGGADTPVIEMNEEAQRHLVCGQLVVIPGASHLFEEPGTLEAVARNAIQWFGRYFLAQTSKTAA